MCKGDPVHLQGILLRQGNTDRIQVEVPKAILFHPEAVWKEDQVIHQVRIILLLQEAADLHHHIAADLQVPDQEVPHQDLHQEDLHLMVLLREGDSLTR
jgi:hypothetical protein